MCQPSGKFSHLDGPILAHHLIEILLLQGPGKVPNIHPTCLIPGCTDGSDLCIHPGHDHLGGVIQCGHCHLWIVRDDPAVEAVQGIGCAVPDLCSNVWASLHQASEGFPLICESGKPLIRCSIDSAKDAAPCNVLCADVRSDGVHCHLHGFTLGFYNCAEGGSSNGKTLWIAGHHPTQHRLNGPHPEHHPVPYEGPHYCPGAAENRVDSDSLELLKELALLSPSQGPEAYGESILGDFIDLLKGQWHPISNLQGIQVSNGHGRIILEHLFEIGDVFIDIIIDLSDFGGYVGA